MSHDRDDQPLPGTARFLAGLGAFIVIGWLLMYALMASRW
jgi:hypothetical protein